MRYFKNLLLSFVIFLALAQPVFSQTDESINKGIDYLKSQQQSNGQIAGFNGVSAWAAMAFSGAGIDIATITAGGSSLLDYLKSNPPGSGAPATDWEREILAITSAGQNPFDFNGKNYTLALESMANNSQIGDLNLLNDDMFGLLALISAGNGSDNRIKQDALNYILVNQDPGGGFGYSKTSGPDIDTTAAAIQALEAGKDAGLSNGGLASAINSAKSYLLSGQNPDGGFGYLPGETSNASTTAWAVMALSALDDHSDTAKKAINYLVGTQEGNGSFEWQSGFPGDTFTSSFAILALSGEFWPVKVFEVASPSPSPSPSPIPSASPSAMPTPSAAPSASPSITPSPSASPSPSVIPSAMPSAKPSSTPRPKIEFEFNMEELIAKQKERMTQMRQKQRQSFKRLRERLHSLFKWN